MIGAVPPAIAPEAVESLFALAFGFAFAGMCASGYRLHGDRFPSFRLLEVGPTASRFAAIPLLMFSAPFIIMRNTLRGHRIERDRRIRPTRPQHVGENGPDDGEDSG